MQREEWKHHMWMLLELLIFVLMSLSRGIHWCSLNSSANTELQGSVLHECSLSSFRGPKSETLVHWTECLWKLPCLYFIEVGQRILFFYWDLQRGKHKSQIIKMDIPGFLCVLLLLSILTHITDILLRVLKIVSEDWFSRPNMQQTTLTSVCFDFKVYPQPTWQCCD